MVAPPILKILARTLVCDTAFEREGQKPVIKLLKLLIQRWPKVLRCEYIDLVDFKIHFDCYCNISGIFDTPTQYNKNAKTITVEFDIHLPGISLSEL